MSKQEMLVEYITQDIIEILTERMTVDFDEAMKIFYSSVTFEKLSDIETGLYLESSAYILALLSDELKIGTFVQNEI